jgi:hypothetical protein
VIRHVGGELHWLPPREREGGDDEDDVRRSTNVTVNPRFLLNIIIF